MLLYGANQVRNLGPWLRTRADILLLHYLMARSETTRDYFKLSSLSSVLLDNEGSECIAMIVTLNKGKTIITGRDQYGGAMRARQPEDCCLGALAQWLFWRWQVNGEEPPDFNNRADWYDQRVFPAANDRMKGFSYDTQSEWQKRVFRAVGILSSKLTHTMRGSAARMADLMGLEAEEGSPPFLQLSILLTSYRSCEPGDGYGERCRVSI
jgi:hypothetical protein